METHGVEHCGEIPSDRCDEENPDGPSDLRAGRSQGEGHSAAENSGHGQQGRQEIIEYLQRERQRNFTADLAFYAYRDMESCDWAPFIKAAVERNPISIRMTESMSPEQVYQWLGQMRNLSIYDGKRLAQPDEVANFQTGDGLEKAFLLANVIRGRGLAKDIELLAEKDKVFLRAQDEYAFASGKGLAMKVRIS